MSILKLFSGPSPEKLEQKAGNKKDLELELTWSGSLDETFNCFPARVIQKE